MANLYYADRCFETTSTQGTGTLSLLGAQAGFRTIKAGMIHMSADAVGPWDCYYCLEDGINWEVGRGTLTSGIPDTLTRSTVLASSNGNAAVNWGPGTRNLFVVAPANVFSGIAALASSNTFTANQTVKLVDAGSAEGPVLTLDRESSTPAAADLLAALGFSGRSSTAVTRTYAKLLASILDPTNASEDAEFAIQTMVAGALASRVIVGQGVRIGAPTGSDPGAGKLNAVDLQVNGTAVALQGKQTAWVPALAMYPRLTNGAASGTFETATNKVIRKSWDFDSAVQEFVQFAVRFPKSFNNLTVSAIPIWTAASGSGGVAFAFQALARSDGELMDTASAFGTEQVSTDTLIAALDIHLAPETAAITIGNTPATGDWVGFQVKRNVSDAGDTLGVDAVLLGIVLLFSTNAGNDA